MRFHPIYYEVILSTSGDGFHIFKPALDDDLSEDENEREKDIPKIKESDLNKFFGDMNLNDNKWKYYFKLIKYYV